MGHSFFGIIGNTYALGLIMKTVMLFDLEGVLVDSWESFADIAHTTHDTFASLIAKHAPDCIGLMSWAVWNQAEKKRVADSGVLASIENQFGVKVNPEWVLDTSEWIALANRGEVHKIQHDDIFSVCWKDAILCKIARHTPDTHFILVDDRYGFDMHATFPKNNSMVTIEIVPWET